MNDQATNPSQAEQIPNAIGLYGVGFICPGEVWNIIENAIGHDDPIKVLDSCVTGVRVYLKAIFRDRPWDTRPERPELSAAIRAWCLRP